MESSSSCNTMMMSLDRAARLNNRGVELLGAGDLNNAREFFRQALASLTVSARALTHLPADSAKSTHRMNSCKMQVSMDSVPWLSSTKDISTSDANLNFDSTIYNRAIPVPIVDHSSSSGLYGESEDTFNQTLSSSCCIFNLALIYHLRAMQIMSSPSSNKQSGNQRQHLLKAKSLYAKCSSLVFSMGLGCYVGRHPVADLLSMAVLNNHAHVCHELASYDAAHDCIDCLVQIMSRVSPCTYRNQDAQFVIHQAKQNFHLNAMILVPPAVAHAA